MSYKNLAWFAIGNSPGTAGHLTVGAAVDGLHVTLGSADDGLSFAIRIFEAGVGSEVRTGCTYTHGTTTLSRGTLESSTSGSELDFTSAAQVQILGATSASATLLEIAMQSIIPGGRLTTESGVPVSTSDRTSQSTIYYTPFVHNKIPLWDGSQWKPVVFAETSLALSGLTSGKPYDVFGYISSGALALELLAWTDDTTRATAVTLQDGRYCKSGDKTRLLLGTIYTTGTNTTEDSGFGSTTSAPKRYVWNAYNRVKRTLLIEEDTASWSWSTAATWRQVRASTDNQVEVVVGLSGSAMVDLIHNSTGARDIVNGSLSVAIGHGSTTAPAAECTFSYSASYNGVTGTPLFLHSSMRKQPAAGRHVFAMIEAFNGPGNGTGYGTNTVARRTAMGGWVEA